VSWGLGRGCDLKTFICDFGFWDAHCSIGDVIVGLIQSDVCRHGLNIWCWGCDLRLSGLDV
jgi:hypothetical protein